MTQATNHRRSLPEILAALQAQVEAVQWEGQPAFGSVQLFDVTSLEQAFQELIASQQRVCFIVPDDEAFEPKLQAGKLLITRRLPVALLISDRVLGSRQKALYGDGLNTPGAFALAELCLAAVTGQLLDKPNGVQCVPKTSAVLHLDNPTASLPGRSCVELDLECTGGTLEATLALGPTL